MQLKIEHALESWLAQDRCCIGQVRIKKCAGEIFRLSHREDEGRDDLVPESDAAKIAKFDDAGEYRPLRTVPNLRRGWRLDAIDDRALRHAIELLYPGRLAALSAFERGSLRTTPLRETLERQTGMYRIAATVSDSQIDRVVGNFCRSDGGCLRTILWKRDSLGTLPSTVLPTEKYDPDHDQTGRNERSMPLLCQEACSLLVNECRKAVKMEGAASAVP